MRRAPQLGQKPRRSPKAPTVGTTERDQSFLVAVLAPYSQETVFEPAALQVVFEFPLNIAGQRPALPGQLLPESRVVLRKSDHLEYEWRNCDYNEGFAIRKFRRPGKSTGVLA